MDTEEFITGLIKDLDKYHEAQIEMFDKVIAVLKGLNMQQERLLLNLKSYAGSTDKQGKDNESETRMD